MRKMAIYIASFFETKARLLPIREEFRGIGHEITSNWLDEGKKPDSTSRFDWWRSLAEKDFADIKRADALILDTLDVNPRGGREVEWGFAHGSVHKKVVMIVGPMRNVFHTLCDKQFRNWEDCLIYAAGGTDRSLNEPWIADPVEEARKKREEAEILARNTV